MNGLDAHCPQSGAQLSDEQVTPEQDGTKKHYSTSLWHSRGGGDLTNGERVSSREALTALVTRWHQHHTDDPDRELYQAAAGAVRKLKRTEAKVWNVHAWHALHAHLDQRGFQVDWMLAHVEHVCPHCHGDLVWEEHPRGHRPRCWQRCINTEPVDDAIADAVEAAYHRAFDDPGFTYEVTHP